MCLPEACLGLGRDPWEAKRLAEAEGGRAFADVRALALRYQVTLTVTLLPSLILIVILTLKFNLTLTNRLFTPLHYPIFLS